MTQNTNQNAQSSSSHSAQILRHLQSGKTITAIEALELFGCFRLTSRIYDLTQRGHDIFREYITLSNGKRVMRYKLKH